MQASRKTNSPTCYIYYYHYFIIVVVVVDDNTYYWIYLSSDHLFQVYYKVRQVLLQSAIAFFITKCDGLLLLSATAFFITSATRVFTKCDRSVQSVLQVLESETIFTKCDRTNDDCWFQLKSLAFILSTTANSKRIYSNLISVHGMPLSIISRKKSF